MNYQELKKTADDIDRIIRGDASNEMPSGLREYKKSRLEYMENPGKESEDYKTVVADVCQWLTEARDKADSLYKGIYGLNGPGKDASLYALSLVDSLNSLHDLYRSNGIEDNDFENMAAKSIFNLTQLFEEKEKSKAK